jgi:hypothetical protein
MRKINMAAINTASGPGQGGMFRAAAPAPSGAASSGAAPSGAFRRAGRAMRGRPMTMADGGKVSAGKGKMFKTKQISMRKG